MASTIVEARGVTKDFGTVQAVRGVDLSIAPGELFGLIGHNGAGKSTLFKMMLGLIPITSGEIRLDGEPVNGPRFRETRRKIGYLPENVVLYDNLTGLETLYFFADLKAVPRRECAGLLDKVGLSHAAGRRVREYSKGMRQRLGFAQALLGTPRLLFLDEPTTGLDPGAIRDFYRILRELKGEGVTMVLTSHILAEIQERVDRLAVMEGGLIRATGTVQALREAMNLPLTLEIAGGAGLAEQVGRVLEGIAIESIEEAGSVLHICLPREAKMPALARLATLGDTMRDLRVREPSLEDVFFGYRNG
ncbi:copper ABC transporter ATP-binding protein [Zoogloea ramigera]|uniref:Copper ABC transporter ATP-binding protein n=1 Tax=Zoogloea ramigera TaxID=350 RepID=A0A4Y4CNR9_ZOORA|nr:ABC transporter ATP-binding protein [Zoogloea ramigera]GEC94591.1 copper ABC transporter ATP-binding protein [Zoogloea ramigera]